ncbi:MAG TPA: zinc ribbon domain-containing protein [Desulfuromonadales bacterium]|nr:zinc ribbon domain-containing protein [Desulfuromonadales bacterium]
MILIFLIILGLLAFAILEELEKEQPSPAATTGNCPDCGCRTESDWLLCPQCRTLLKSLCKGCGHAVPHCHNYCTHCGAPRSQEKL